ncbi:hypothetical protein DAPPUDRAFT_251524 [Daphnia pulex]|uniref:RNase III domain-containing protein n=1 Tax=Daphnia pulex TaxID=6669 RepID=E9H0L7_DAPPU|nr:hypothetical protein DAPPUDRAFT_251524 [Daphnia pulex]|eukprot:EFX74669.1 hypothetical protein DAPPUDRAFT_251524 [Daphnia pulex]
MANQRTILELNGERERGKNSKDRPSKRMRLVPTLELFEGLEKLEEILNYEFRYKNLLLQALIYSRKIAVFRPCYERLHLGDAFLGGLAAEMCFDALPFYPPSVLSELKSVLVCNNSLGVLVVKFKFHKFLKRLPREIQTLIDTFAKKQKANGHKFPSAYYEIVKLGNPPEDYAATNVPPDVLGDIFESIAGAVYKDSNYSMKTFRTVMTPFLNYTFEIDVANDDGVSDCDAYYITACCIMDYSN